jgi:FAD/FMN-containing dehydrogenase
MSTDPAFESWGRYPKAKQEAVNLSWISELPPLPANGHSVLAYGLGRSYGDVCLNDGGSIWLTQRLNRFISLEDILQLTVAKGWFLPVTPGTKFVTVGGAVANDVHGKNHHLMGTFGEHVRALELWRSNGERLVCTPSQNVELFRATIGGMGLTGLMLWVEFQLKKIPGPFIAVEYIKYQNLDDFFRLAKESEAAFEYTVAWVDCLASGSKLGRGIFMRGNDASAEQTASLRPARVKRPKKFPCEAPDFFLNRFTVAAFNTVYYHKQFTPRVNKLTHYDPFFYPLDSVLEWNRLYGRRGFFQYQFVVPYENSTAATADILQRISKSGAASFLSVMKTFGDRPPAGMMSFPKKGVTLALDLPNLGGKLLRLLDDLDEVVLKNGGVIYPAKDARMSPRHFKTFYPQWKEFAKFIDPRFSSGFWRRVTAESPVKL